MHASTTAVQFGWCTAPTSFFFSFFSFFLRPVSMTFSLSARRSLSMRQDTRPTTKRKHAHKKTYPKFNQITEYQMRLFWIARATRLQCVIYAVYTRLVAFVDVYIYNSSSGSDGGIYIYTYIYKVYVLTAWTLTCVCSCSITHVAPVEESNWCGRHRTFRKRKDRRFWWVGLSGPAKVVVLREREVGGNRVVVVDHPLWHWFNTCVCFFPMTAGRLDGWPRLP